MIHTILHRLKTIKDRSNRATDLGKQCPQKAFLFDADTNIVARIAETGLGAEQANANHDFFHAAKKDIDALYEMVTVALEASEIVVSGQERNDDTFQAHYSNRMRLRAAVHSMQTMRRKMDDILTRRGGL